MVGHMRYVCRWVPSIPRVFRGIPVNGEAMLTAYSYLGLRHYGHRVDRKLEGFRKQEI